MPEVRFPPHLRNQFPLPERCDVAGGTVAEVITNLERQYPGVAGYLLDDQGALRKHVNIFLDSEWLKDRKSLTDSIAPGVVVYVMQALSGG